jgi:hypothetical protein
MFGIAFWVVAACAPGAVAQTGPVFPGWELWPLLASSKGQYVHSIPLIPLKGCTEADLANGKEFSDSRVKLHEKGLISGRELIYAHMLYTEMLACGGGYDRAKYCEVQGDYLSRLEIIYRGAGKPDVERLPLPGHHLRNVMALRTRCSD